jgi:hypothetical protein
MRAAGSRTAIPALARMLEISTHHACETGEQTTLADPRSPQSIILSSILDGTGRRSHDHSGHQPLSNRHRARCSWVLCLPRLRALQVCRRRPTPGVAAVPHGRHPQTLYGAIFVKGVPQGSYPFSRPSVSLFDLGSPFLRPDPRDRLGPARAGAVKDGRAAPPGGLVLDGSEHGGTLERVGMTKSEGSCVMVHEGTCHVLVCGGPKPKP